MKEISSEDDALGKAAKEVLEAMEVTPSGRKFSKGEDEALKLLTEAKADLLISDDIEFVKKHRKNEKISFSVILFGILLEKNLTSPVE